MKFWNFISDIGLSKKEDLQHIRFVHILNRVFFMSYIFMLCYFPINVFFEDPFMIKVLVFSSVLMLVSFLLNHKKQFRLSGYYSFLLIIVILSISIIVHNNIGVEYLMIPSSLGAFVVFKRKRDSFVILFIFIVACAFTQFAKYYLAPVIEYPERSRMILYYSNIFISFSISCSVIINFKTVISSYENRLLLQKETLEHHNKEITDSIKYAKGIQQAKLPKKELIQASLKNCFIFNQPKDIVSGDFYYFHQAQDSVLLAAADCTGHGVPGALMSMLASAKLSEFVQTTHDLSEVLQQTNKGIKSALHQSELDTASRDGMDLAICSVDLSNKNVAFAGANRPIWLIRKGSSEIEEFKTTKTSIGGHTENHQVFSSTHLQLKEGDTFYMFSDGFADQFNAEGKKLGSRKFKHLLSAIQLLNMQEQELYLKDFIKKWKGSTEQIDDMLVIGVRMS